jgi:hypothetical protein
MEKDRNTPATKGDLAEVRLEMKGDLAELRSEMKRDLEDHKVEVNMRFEAFEHRLEQMLSDMEGRIITSNYRLAESMQQRIKQGEGSLQRPFGYAGRALTRGREATEHASS